MPHDEVQRLKPTLLPRIEEIEERLREIAREADELFDEVTDL